MLRSGVALIALVSLVHLAPNAMAGEPEGRPAAGGPPGILSLGPGFTEEQRLQTSTLETIRGGAPGVEGLCCDAVSPAQPGAITGTINGVSIENTRGVVAVMVNTGVLDGQISSTIDARINLGAAASFAP